MSSKSVFLVLVVLSVITVAIQAAAIQKRDVKPEERPEEPLLPECDDPSNNRELCFSIDPGNVDIWQVYLDEIKEWEKKNPTAAEVYNKANPDKKTKEQEKLAELEKIAKIHEA
ncbi:unnamed protein product [Orchesella dallaii]|uniref:Uncharacterized protein n=1 Tax=Orchesella dallaii TaxID=48710 RepID=A0ABP1Q3U7_9HEXA